MGWARGCTPHASKVRMRRCLVQWCAEQSPNVTSATVVAVPARIVRIGVGHVEAPIVGVAIAHAAGLGGVRPAENCGREYPRADADGAQEGAAADVALGGNLGVRQR